MTSARLPRIQVEPCDDAPVRFTSAGRPIIVYDGAVTRVDLDMWESEFVSLLGRVHPLFYRTESKKHAEQYLRGLLAPLARKNGWTIAEYVGEPEPKALQRLLNLSPWDVDALLDLNREYAMEHLASPGGILVADPTGFAKKGTKSVGTQRQYSGTLGQIDNCQIATFIAYVTPERDRVLIDRRLYMPEESWLADPARCAAAGVPADLTFATRPAQVIEMVEATRAAGVPFAWFTADEEFGQNPGLRDHLEANQIPYVMAVPKNTRFTDAAGRSHQMDELAQRLKPNAWQRRACGIGSKGFRVYDWALIDSADPDHQYMYRRSIQDQELTFYHCYNPRGAGFGELVHVAGARWPIEECFGTSKNEVGLDNYQVRTWNAWHRHITFAMLAHTFLAVTARKTNEEKQKRQKSTPSNQPNKSNQQSTPPGNPIEPETPAPTTQRIHRRLIALTLAEIRRLLSLVHRGERAIAHGLHWSTYRRQHQAEARRAHTRRHLQLQILTI
jgi:SRSO17 transposase